MNTSITVFIVGLTYCRGDIQRPCRVMDLSGTMATTYPKTRLATFGHHAKVELLSPSRSLKKIAKRVRLVASNGSH